MTDTVLAATLVAPLDLRVVRYPMPSELEAGAVLVRMLASGHLWHRQAHVPRGDGAVRRDGSRQHDALPDHPGPRERRGDRRDRGRWCDGVRRHATRRRRPDRTGPQSGLREVPVLRRGLPVLLLPQPGELRQLSDLCRAAPPLRRVRRVPLPVAGDPGLQGPRRSSRRGGRADRAVRRDPLARSGCQDAAAGRFPSRRLGGDRGGRAGRGRAQPPERRSSVPAR